MAMVDSLPSWASVIKVGWDWTSWWPQINEEKKGKEEEEESTGIRSGALALIMNRMVPFRIVMPQKEGNGAVMNRDSYATFSRVTKSGRSQGSRQEGAFEHQMRPVDVPEPTY